MTLPFLPLASLGLVLLGGGRPAMAQDDAARVAYPKRAVVQLTDCGTCVSGVAKVVLPPELRSVDDPDDGSDLLLVDASGQPVPFAVARGAAPRERTSLRVWRTDRADTVSVEAPGLPIDGIEVSVPGDAVVGRVTVRHAQTGAVLAGPTLVWTHEVGEHRQVDLVPTVAPLEVQFSWLGRSPDRMPGVTGLRSVPPSLEPVRITAPVASQRVSEDGTVDYTIQLESALPVRAVDLGSVDAAVVSRQVEVVASPSMDRMIGATLGRGEIKRVRVGEATLDAMTVSLDATPPSDRLVVRVSSQGQPILELDELDVLLEGESIWFRPDGPGPYTLYAGAPTQTRPPSELQLALAELVRLPLTTAQLHDVGDNPDFVPPVLRSGLAGPGRSLPSPGAFAFIAPVGGATGMARIPLGLDIQAASARQLHDLRLTDTDGNQVPHLLRGTGVEPATTIALDTVERTEDGGISRLVIPIADPDVAVATVTIQTDATAFRRRVTVLMPAADRLVPLRSVHWSGSERPGSLGIAVDSVIGDTLVVEIDNGDDPPLPLSGVSVSRPGWELVAVLPEGGATLHVGDLGRELADFDLQLYADDLTQRATAVATVGPLEAQAPAPLALIDRAALLAGLVVLVAGLAGLTVRLLRSVPAPDADDPDDPASEDPSLDTPDPAPADDVPAAEESADA